MSIVLPNGRLPWWKRFGASFRNLFFWRDSKGNKYPPLAWKRWLVVLVLIAIIAVNRYHSGYDAGYEAGRNPFYKEGHTAGWNAGWYAGYQKGKIDGESGILSKIDTVRIATGTKGTLLLDLFGTPASIEDDSLGYIFWKYDDVVFKMSHTYANDVPSVVSFVGDLESLKQKQLKKANSSSVTQ